MFPIVWECIISVARLALSSRLIAIPNPTTLEALLCTKSNVVGDLNKIETI